MKKAIIIILSFLLIFGVCTGLLLKYNPDSTTGEPEDTTVDPSGDNPPGGPPVTPWDGVTITAPEGKGTREEPYLIESGANLAWMSAEIGDGSVEDGVYSDPFATSFFLQTKDINLGGHTLNSIGYYVPFLKAFTSDEISSLYVFGGYYDGDQHKIMNGKLQNPALRTVCDPSYGTGLFGAIQGATVTNVHLESMVMAEENHDSSSVLSYGSAGFVVGIAAYPTYESGSTVYLASPNANSNNTILNCRVDSSCVLKTSSTSTHANSNWGGIVGLAYNTTMLRCVNSATLQANRAVCNVGGLVGAYTYGTDIMQCVNKGDIIFDEFTTIQYETIIGGLAGDLIYMNGNSAGAFNRISQSYNCGNILRELQNSSGSKYMVVGGILGRAANPPSGYGSEIHPIPNELSACYNLGNIYQQGSDSRTRAAALVGTAFLSSDGEDCSSLTVKECKSVPITSSVLPLSNYGSTLDEGVILWMQRLVANATSINGVDISDLRKNSYGDLAIIDGGGNEIVDAEELQELVATIDAAINGEANG